MPSYYQKFTSFNGDDKSYFSTSGSISSSHTVRSCRSSSSSIDSDGNDDNDNDDDDEDMQDHANEEDMDEADDEFTPLPALHDSMPLDAMKLPEAELDGMLKALGCSQHSSMEYEHSIEDKHSMEDNSTAADVEDEYHPGLVMYSMFTNCLGNSLQPESFTCVVETPKRCQAFIESQEWEASKLFSTLPLIWAKRRNG